MKDKRFDDMVVGKLHGYASLVPPGMWERIQGKAKKRRFIAWWWVGGGVVAGIVIFYFLTTGKISSENRVEQQQETVYKNPTLPTQNQPHTKLLLPRKANYAPIKNTSSAKPEIINKYARINAASDNGFLHFNKPGEQQYAYRPAILEDSSLTKTSRQSDEIDDEELHPWFAEVFAAPLIGFNSADISGFLQSEKREGTTGASMHAGMMIGKYIGKRWTLKGGLLYSSLSVKKDRLIDSLVSYRTGIKEMIDLPVIGGYHVGNGNLKVSANVGIIVNVLARYKDNGNNVTQKNIGLKSYTGVSLLYPVRDKFKVYIEPFYIHHFGNISRSRYLKQQIHEAGLSVGLRYSIDSRQHY